MKHKTEQALADVFLNKEWSHNNVKIEATEAFVKNRLSYKELPQLSDVDTVDDLKGELLKALQLIS